jgi:hypothetical protein
MLVFLLLGDRRQRWPGEHTRLMQMLHLASRHQPKKHTLRPVHQAANWHDINFRRKEAGRMQGL